MGQKNSTGKHSSSPRDAQVDDTDRSRPLKGKRGEETADRTNARSTGEDAAPPEAAAAGDDRNKTAEGEKLADELASLQTELEEAKDHTLRCRAEMENFKKRLGRQAEEERRYACGPMMHDLLPVLDNMDRAIDAAEKSENGAGLLEGFSMVAQQLRGVLAKYDCIEIEALHKPFDPNHHQAVSQQLSEEFPAHTVVAVIEPGYQLHDRVIRPTKVIVSTKQPSEDSEE